MQQSVSRTLYHVHQQVMQLNRQQLQLQQVLEQTLRQQAEDRIVLKNLQKQLLKSNVGLLPKEISKTNKGKLSYQLAKDVSSVVGLKEAITWKSKFLKCVWAIALCAGVAATAFFVFATTYEYMSKPTATRVEIISAARYNYPAIILCPPLWLDADKALSLGLSVEGLKYSLGYVNLYREKFGPENSEVGRREFFSFFNKSNYSCFDDYWMDISHDIPVEPSVEIYDGTFYPSAYCPRCNVSFLSKILTAFGVCYNFEMKPEKGRERLNVVSRLIGLQVRDRSRGLINTSLWNLYVGTKQELSLKNPVVPQAVLKEFTFTKVGIHEVYITHNRKRKYLVY